MATGPKRPNESLGGIGEVYNGGQWAGKVRYWLLVRTGRSNAGEVGESDVTEAAATVRVDGTVEVQAGALLGMNGPDAPALMLMLEDGRQLAFHVATTLYEHDRGSIIQRGPGLTG